MKKTISLLVAVVMLLAMLPVVGAAAAEAGTDLFAGAGAFDSNAFGNTVAFDATVDRNNAENSGSMKLSSEKKNHSYVLQSAKAGTIYTATMYVMFEAGEFSGNSNLQLSIYESNAGDSSTTAANHRLQVSYGTGTYERGVWNKIQISFKTDVDTNRLNFTFNNADATKGAIWVDDVILEEHDFVDANNDTFCDLSYYDMTGINGQWNTSALLNACEKSCGGQAYAETDVFAGAGSFNSNAFGNAVAFDSSVDHNNAANSGSMKLSSAKKNHSYVYQTAKAGTIYTATMYVMFEEGSFSGNSNLQLSIYEANAADSSTTAANHRLQVTVGTGAYQRGVWNKIVVSFKTDVDTNRLNFTFNNADATRGAIWVDDVTLTEHKYVDKNGDHSCDVSYYDMTGINGNWNSTALLNACLKTCAGKIQLNETDLMAGAGSFDGSAEAFLNDYYDGTVDRLGNANSGSLKLETGKTNSAFILNDANPGAIYTVKFYMMFEVTETTNQGILGFSIFEANAEETNTLDADRIESQYKTTTLGKGVWSQEITITFKTAEDTDKVRVHFLNYTPDRGAVYIDDVRLYEHVCSDFSGDGYCDCEFYDMTGITGKVSNDDLPALVKTCGAWMPAENDLMNAAGYFNGSAQHFQNGKYYDGTVDRSNAEGSGSLKLDAKTNAAYILDVEEGGIYTAKFYVMFEDGEEFAGKDTLQLSIYEAAAGETTTGANHRIQKGYNTDAIERGQWSNEIKVTVTFNYRYAPYKTKIKELLRDGAIGDVFSIHFEWLLDRNMDVLAHGTSYFRRWNSRMKNSGGLLVHKATHHFDLVNWWINQNPVRVSGFGKLNLYGTPGSNKYADGMCGENCRRCSYKDKCGFYFQLPEIEKKIYADNEHIDGYFKDGCVYASDIDIFDTMAVNVEYDGGALLTYSLNATCPYEGWRIVFNGSKGRLEAFYPETGPDQEGLEYDIIRVYDLDNKFTEYKIERIHGNHGGGDLLLHEMLFRDNVPDPLNLAAGTADGAKSCIIGACANISIWDKRMVEINDYLSL